MSDITSPLELTQHLNKALESYFAEYYRDKCYVGLIFEQGKRQMVQINVPAHDLPILLQAKPSTGNDPNSGKNRPEVDGHADEVKQYILKRINNNKPWILGTLTANVAPSKITLIELARGICFVVIPRGVKLDITDGQHRKSAIHELIESATGELVGDNDFPITIVLEEDFKQCQTDFRDMAQTKALDKSLLLSFGEFEGRVGILKNLLQQVLMFAEKTEQIKSSPSTKKKHIYAMNYIAKMVSCVFADDANAELEAINVEDASNALATCLNQFFSECHQTRHIVETSMKNLTVEQVDKFIKTCILGRSVGLEILGRLLYSVYDKQNNCFERIKISQLAQLNWSISGDIWQGNIVILDPKPKNPANPYKITASISPVKIAVHQAKVKLGWVQDSTNLDF
jgi:DNA sulfur modification protein DndB